jgi:cyclohexa-1,5-dienecarbonyl-CoA hydratase
MDAMSERKFIRFAIEYDVARLTLARPPLNIMTIEMMQEMETALDEAAKWPTLKALVIAGEGKAFSAGVAIEDHVGDRVKPMLDTFHGLFRRMRALDCVTVAAVHGAALGGGAELAIFCDVVVAADTARFGQPEIKVGVFPPVAALRYPERIGVPRTLSLLLSGELVDAAEAARIGLIDRVVPPGELEAAVEAQLERFRAASAPVLRMAKRAIRDSAGLDFQTGLAALEDMYRYELMATEDAAEGLRAFLEKRKPVWKDR